MCAQAQQAVDGLKVTGDKTAAKQQIKALYKTFTESDCTMVEVCSASSTHQGGFAQRDLHMTPVWQSSTSMPSHHPLSIQLSELDIYFRHSSQQDLTYIYPGQLKHHHVMVCRSIPWQRQRMGSS